MHVLLDSVSAHSYSVLAVVAAGALLASFAVVGTLVPARAILFAAGAFVGAGTLDGWFTLGMAVLGAAVGDALSYELGRRYHDEVRGWWSSGGHEAALVRGERFVERHGSKSILLARFAAPVRTVVPLVAGVARMPRGKFHAINLASGLAWSSVHLFPGMLFGVTARLAQALSTRLAVLLLIVAALIWFTVTLTRLGLERGVPLVESGIRHALHRLRRRHAAVAKRLFVILDPAAPDFRLRAVLALLLVGSVWLLIVIVHDVAVPASLVHADRAIHTFLQGLRTAPTDRLMVRLTELGGARVRLSVAAIVGTGLIAGRRWRTTACWISAVGTAEGVVMLLKLTVGRARPLGLYEGVDAFSFPSGHATGSMVIYGLLAFLLARRQAPVARRRIAVIAAVAIVLIGFSRLYLGAHWLTDVVGGWSLGLACVALAGFIYTHRQVSERVPPRTFGGLAMVGLLAGGTWATILDLDADLARYAPLASVHGITADQWADTGWQQLPHRRVGMDGEEAEPFPLQWADSATAVQGSLARAGWQPAPAWSVRAALLWFSPRAPIDQRPVLPRFTAGERSELVFIASDPRQPGARTVLRLWRSRYVWASPAGVGGEPIWYGALYQETFRDSGHLVTVGVTSGFPDAAAIAHLLPAGLTTLSPLVAQGDANQRVLLVLPDDLKSRLHCVFSPINASLSTAENPSVPPRRCDLSSVA